MRRLIGKDLFFRKFIQQQTECDLDLGGGSELILLKNISR